MAEISKIDPFGEEEWEEEFYLDVNNYRDFDPIISRCNIGDYGPNKVIHYNGAPWEIRNFEYPYIQCRRYNQPNNYFTNRLYPGLVKWYKGDIPEEWESKEIDPVEFVNRYNNDRDYLEYDNVENGTSVYPYLSPVKCDNYEGTLYIFNYDPYSEYHVFDPVRKSIFTRKAFNLRFNKKFMPVDWDLGKANKYILDGIKLYNLIITIDNGKLFTSIDEIGHRKDRRMVTLVDGLRNLRVANNIIIDLLKTNYSGNIYQNKNIITFTNKLDIKNPDIKKEITTLVKRRMSSAQGSYTRNLKKINVSINNLQKKLNKFKDIDIENKLKEIKEKLMTEYVKKGSDGVVININPLNSWNTAGSFNINNGYATIYYSNMKVDNEYYKKGYFIDNGNRLLIKKNFSDNEINKIFDTIVKDKIIEIIENNIKFTEESIITYKKRIDEINEYKKILTSQKRSFNIDKIITDEYLD